MVTENFITKNSFRIIEDWDSFLAEHPEIQVKLHKGIITDVIFPKKAKHTTLVILSGKVAHLEYFINGDSIKYSSPNAHQSAIYALIEEYNRKLAEK